MQTPDFAPMKDQPLSTIMQMMADAGYRLLPIAARGTLAFFAHPSTPDQMLCLSFMTPAALATTSISAAQPDNPYLPRVHSHQILPGEPLLSIMVMERLYGHTELPADTAPTVIGIGRAAALLPEGETQHGSAHAYMLKNKKLRGAVHAFAVAVTQSLEGNSDHALFYDSGIPEDMPLDQQISENILFRPEGCGWRPVYAAPLLMLAVRGPDHRAALLTRALAMVTRCHPPAP